MSHLSVKGEQSTTTEVAALTALTNLATSAANEVITKTGPTSFANVVATGGGGDVVGPSSSTDSALTLFDGTTGKLLKNSTATLSSSLLSLGSRNITTSGNINTTGSIASTGSRILKGWFTDIESTNLPTVGGTAIKEGIRWSEVTADTNGVINTAYITNKAGTACVITLPTTAAVGSIIRVSGKNATGWKIAQNASEIIHFGNLDTTTGVTGYISSTATRDAVELVCVVADTEWNVISSQGNITVA